ncbi:MAG TPA: TetR/AcrR family transcriptional regulator [Steroidobacteraceae bacterium]|nr:TetR/AcrR family transcriptional regulator [Steroidobacteraceae bacterium]
MPRKRAEDYDDKRQKILDTAAAMFAKLGYVGCNMEDIADKCGVSKSMLYYYFPKKEDILFAILTNHMHYLNGAIEDHLKNADATDVQEFFRLFLHAYLDKTSNMRERHAVSLNDTRFLPRELTVKQEELERQNVALVTELITRVSPGFSAVEYKLYAFLLIGMINWIELWYRDSGPIQREDLYDRIASLFLKGFLAGYPSKRAPAAGTKAKGKPAKNKRPRTNGASKRPTPAAS